LCAPTSFSLDPHPLLVTCVANAILLAQSAKLLTKEVSPVTEASCLRIYLSESSKIDGKPAMENILALCHDAGLSAVSVLRGIEGMGKHGIHSVSFLALSSDLPLIIEAIDTTERIETALAQMQSHLGDCTIATWPVSLRSGNLNEHGAKHGND